MPKANEALIRARFVALSPVMDERMRRLWAGAEAAALGGGGIAAVERATGLSRTTIRAGRNELGGTNPGGKARVRRAGGGRRLLEEAAPSLCVALEKVMQGDSPGEAALVWTRKSAARLRQELVDLGYRVSLPKVRQLLSALDYRRLGSVVERAEASQDYEEQLTLIAERVPQCIENEQPVVCVLSQANVGRTRAPLKTLLIAASEQLAMRYSGRAIYCLTPLVTVLGMKRDAWELEIQEAAEHLGVAIWAAQVPPAILRFANSELLTRNRGFLLHLLKGHSAGGAAAAGPLGVFGTWPAPRVSQGWYADLNTFIGPRRHHARGPGATRE